MARDITILGSTGSIGTSTLDVIEHLDGAYRVAGLAAGRGVERLAEQVRRFRPDVVSVADADAAERLAHRLGGAAPEILHGPGGASSVAAESGSDVVVSAIVGAAGLLPTLAAIDAGVVVALANKESLVIAGDLMTRHASRSGATLLPVDSEHNAIHQCLRAGRPSEVRRIVLTASGGPFRGRGAAELAAVTREEALAHPTWSMGPKITIDSATLMNKGLEVIEASWLFGLGPERIEVVVHPQSVVHSMVEFRDASVIAQLGRADMRHPIQYALTWPERAPSLVERLDLASVGTLTFEPPDREAFPCLGLAYRALDEGGDAPARLNAANEEAVSGFLDGRLRFDGIPRVIVAALDATEPRPVETVDDLVEADAAARRAARAAIGGELQRR